MPCGFLFQSVGRQSGKKVVLKLTVHLAAGTVLELLLKKKVLKVSFLIVKGRDIRLLPIIYNGKNISLSFGNLGSVLDAPTKLANCSDIHKSEFCREFYFSYCSN